MRGKATSLVTSILVPVLVLMLIILRVSFDGIDDLYFWMAALVVLTFAGFLAHGRETFVRTSLFAGLVGFLFLALLSYNAFAVRGSGGFGVAYALLAVAELSLTLWGVSRSRIRQGEAIEKLDKAIEALSKSKPDAK